MMDFDPWDSSDWMGVIAIIGAVVIFLVLIGGSYAEHVSREKFDRACVIAGGAPIDLYCVKPGAFIEVKP